MSLPRATAAPLLLFALAVLPGCAQLYDQNLITLGVDLWSSELTGDVRLDAPAVLGSRIDLDQQLDLGKEEIYNYRGNIQLGTSVLEGAILRQRFEGDNRISTAIDFGTVTFPANYDVHTDLDFEYYSGKSKFGLLGLGPIAVGGIVGITYIKVDGELVGTDPLGLLPQQRESESFEGPLPVAGAIATFNLPLGDTFTLFAEAEGTGFYASYLDQQGTFLDAVGRAGVKLGFMRGGVGYRTIDLDVDATDLDYEVNLRLQGPFIFGEIAF